jgi:hypothetical protein
LRPVLEEYLGSAAVYSSEMARERTQRVLMMAHLHRHGATEEPACSTPEPRRPGVKE